MMNNFDRWEKRQFIDEDDRQNFLSYIAGVIDGEGSLQITRKKPTEKSANKSLLHSFVLVVNMTHKETIHFLHKSTDVGTVSAVIPKNPKHTPYYKWQVSTREAEGLLKELYPYSLTKREEYKIAFEFFGLDRKRGRKKLTNDLIADRDKLYWDMRKAKSTFKIG